MIYVQGLQGRQGYQKLHNVLDLNKMEKISKDGYEVLSRAVDENYQTFSSNFRKKQTRPTFSQAKNKRSVKDKEKPSIAAMNKILSVPPQKEQIYIEEKSKEDKFLSLFKKAITNNQAIIKNSDKCIEEIEDRFVKKTLLNKRSKIKLNRSIQHDSPKKNDVYSNERKKQANEEDNSEKSKRANNSSSKDVQEENSDITKIIKIEESEKHKYPNKKESSNRHKLLKKLEKSLVSSLTYLYNNEVSLKEFFEKNPFPSKPYSLPFSHEFFDAVKFEDTLKVENFVNRDKRYLFAIDYFHQTAYHWAAKRGYNAMLTVLVTCGPYVNQTDYNSRTPLWHAAKNNQFQACEILLQKLANPFLEGKCGKRPMDITTDASIRKLLNEYMERYGYMNQKNYFITKVIKSSRDAMINSLGEVALRKRSMLID